jgi:hypothetical protein
MYPAFYMREPEMSFLLISMVPQGHQTTLVMSICLCFELLGQVFWIVFIVYNVFFELLFFDTLTATLRKEIQKIS